MMARQFFRHVNILLTVSTFFLINACGSSSSSSSAPPDTTAPTAPAHVTAVAVSDTRVSLRWAASTDNAGVTAYIIYRGGAQLATTTTATTVYSDTTCTFSTPYTYTVAARDAANNVSAISSGATTTTLAAGTSDSSPPTWTTGGSVMVSGATTSQISLIWNAATDNVGVSGYYIYRAATQFGTPTQVGISTTTSYTDTGLTAATPYYYVVTAFDGALNQSALSSQAAAATQ